MNKFKVVVDRLVSEAGLSRTVSRRIAHKINRMAGTVSWATPVKGAQRGAPAAAVTTIPKSPSPAKLPLSGSLVLPKIPASRTVAKGSVPSARYRPR